MSSAIEVLKEFIGNSSSYGFSKEANNAIDEALLALEKKENYVIDFIKLEVLPKSKKEQFRVFFKDGTEQVFQMERVGEKK